MSEGHFQVIAWNYLYRDCSRLLRFQWTWKGVVVTQAGDSEMRTTLEITTLKTSGSGVTEPSCDRQRRYIIGSKLNLDFLALSQDRIKPTHASIHLLHFLRRQRSRAQTDNLPVGTNMKARSDVQ